jgi:Fungal chitosanase of glycosyl hydrolase group 75
VRRLRLALLTLGVVSLPLIVTTAHAASTNTAAAKPPTTKAGPSAAQLLAKVSGCTQISKGKFRSDDETSANIAICGTKGSKSAPVWWKADMDIDCDGVTTPRCNKSKDPWYQNDTAYHTSNGKPFTADVTHYFVIPQDSASAWHFQRDSGIKLGDVAAVIYNNKVIYAVFADTGPTNIIGEASYATAKDLGINPDPKNGGTDSGVTYIVFPNSHVTPQESNSAITAKGEQMANKFVGG